MSNSLKDRIKNKLNNKDKKGITTLEMILIVMMFVFMLGFFLDSFMILNKQLVATKEANMITRQIAVQGGVSPRVPDGYNRFGQNYMNSAQIIKNVDSRLGGVGIDDYKVAIKNKTANNSNEFTLITEKSNVPIEYKDNFEVRMDYQYEWFILGQMVPGMSGENTRTIVRSGVSELGGDR